MIGATAGLALTLFEPMAAACSCGWEEAIVRPHAEEVAPRESLIWVPSSVAESAHRNAVGPFDNPDRQIAPTPAELTAVLELTRDDGSSIDFDITPIVDDHGSDVYYVLIPTAELAPGDYVLSTQTLSGDPTRFTVGDFSSVGPTSPPLIIDTNVHSESGVGNSCGESRAKSFQLGIDGVFTVARFRSEAEFRRGQTPWRAAVFHQDASVVIGSAACLGQTWDFRDGPVSARFASIDLAGNLSPWTEPERVFVEDPSGGCVCVAAGRASDWGARWPALLSVAFLASLGGVRKLLGIRTPP
jgi:hypothetical protein